MSHGSTLQGIDPPAIHPRSAQARGFSTASYALIEHDYATRRVVEKFIRRCFAEHFGAHVDAFMPRLLTLQRDDGTLCGAFGLRFAQCRLFIEHYLDRPIEQAIAASVQSPIQRCGIVEVGHLCGTSAGTMRHLILLLIARLHHEGFQWVAFTGTQQLRNAFHRMGLFPLDLGAARIQAIPAESRAAWGRYYEHSPHVFAGRILDGFAALKRGHVQGDHQ
ncbi:MAG: thermostable hemolysin [Rhodanobacter sp.]|nr:thermostable hemolysin [Rhodanobacter sp.]